MPDLRQTLDGGKPSLLLGTLPRRGSQSLAVRVLCNPRPARRGRRQRIAESENFHYFHRFTGSSGFALRAMPDMLRCRIFAGLRHAKPPGEAWWTGRIVLTINRRSLKPSRFGCGNAQVAQLVEHATENRSVGGSIPPLGTIPPLSLCFSRRSKSNPERAPVS